MSASPHHGQFDMERLDALLRRALVFNHLGEAMILTAADGTITDWNEGAEAMLGWTRAEALGQTPALFHRPEDAPVLWPSIQAAMARDGRWHGQVRYVGKEGTGGLAVAVAVPLLDHDGRTCGTLLAQSAIEEPAAAVESPTAPVASTPPATPVLRPLPEPLLTDERFLLRTLIDAVPDPIFCKDREGRYLLHNAADRELFAADIGLTVFDIPGLKVHAAQYHADDMAVMHTGQPVINREEPFEKANGKKGWLLTSKFPLRDEQGQIIGLVGIARDVTQMKQAAEELKAAQSRLTDHVENSPLAVIEWEPDLRIARWSGQAEQIFGWKAEEVVGRHFDEFPFVHPEDAVKVSGVVARLINGGENRSSSTSRNLTKSGRVVHCLWQNSVLRDGEGRTVSILSLVQDVTDRVFAEQSSRKVAAERQALERKLQEAQKLESLGVLAGGIAHDFNNLLTGVLGNASLARMDLPEDSPVQPLLEQIESAAVRAADLCKQMLAYSGKGRFVVHRLDLNALIEDTTRLLQVSISKRAVLKFQLAEGLPPVLGDATQLRQVIMNLVINASEAVGEKSGFISITTGLARADRAYLAGTFYAPDLPDGDYLALEIADNGGGMPPEVQARIFDPFFTTKFTGRGLGLAAVLGIVRGHKGALKVFSEAGWGTTFKILLPCAFGPVETPSAETAAPAGWRGSGLTLVVDDEETVRVTTARMLEACGFVTRLADDGRSGFEVFRAAPQDYALVVLDLTMPHMDGEEAFQKMIALRPETRVLLMSGFNEQETTARFSGKGLAGFIQKPFTLPALREKLQQIFAAATPSPSSSSSPSPGERR
jgi:PAS domain S-box-containing protein